MTTRILYFTAHASSTVEVTDEDVADYRATFGEVAEDMDDEEVIREIAYEQFDYPQPCAQCAGWGQKSGIDLGDWELDENQ